jgi:hypothetical protein
MNVLTALAIPLAGALMFGIPATPAPVVDAMTRGGAAEIAVCTLATGSFRLMETKIRSGTPFAATPYFPRTGPSHRIERNGQRMPLTISPTAHVEDGETAGFLDFVPDYGDVPVVVREVEPNTPAAEAGLQPWRQDSGGGGQPESLAPNR